MIPQLLSLFRGYRFTQCSISDTGNNLKIEENIIQFRKGIYFFQFVVLGWLVFKAYNYHILLNRPHELFEPIHYFARIFMPSFPFPILFYGILLLGIAATMYRLAFNENILIRIIQVIIVTWVNVFQWSFGSDSAVSYILIYVLIFSLFMPNSMPEVERQNERKNIIKMIEYYFLAIFITYTFSGLWKVIGLGYKLIFKPYDVNWLSPNGALYNALISHRNYDFPIAPILKYYQYPIFWQVGFLIVLFIQLFCWIAAYRLQVRIWVGLSLIIFHVVNAVFFKTVFITAPMVLFVICFPYHLFVMPKINYCSALTLSPIGELLYTKTYQNGDVDCYKGFAAFREIRYDRHPVWGSLWYVPGAWVIYKILPVQKLI